MIVTRDLRVDYDGVTAVRDLNLTIHPGEVFGLIGPNGAGKTSTIRVLATLQEPTYGEVMVGGIDLLERPRDVHRILGYMPDNPPVYDDLRCWEFLDLFAGAYFVSRRERRRRVDECIEQVDLQSKRHVLAGTLSTGMRQRLVLAKTLLPDPLVLLLDEPASGLDPLARIELRELLRRQGERGRTILVSSHILTELSEFCTSIGIMEKGRLVISGRIDEIITRFTERKRLVVDLHPPSDAAIAWLTDRGQVSGLERINGRVEFDFTGTDDDVVELLRLLVATGAPVRGFFEKRMGVEDILLKVGAREVS
ncbi:MAG: ABC transporter ATP-binding protein [Phycisphaeraceae bacterium]|nr:ABC transporter ATP-binding protein [Phycisphaerales bacterium]QOJ18841.1 MAG: ABC transporter ATP-binding protein [Phycisphaeraceae bacterium]